MASKKTFQPPRDMGGRLFVKSLGNMVKMGRHNPTQILANSKFKELARKSGHYGLIRTAAKSQVKRIGSAKAKKIIRDFQKILRSDERPKGLKIDVKDVKGNASDVYHRAAKKFHKRNIAQDRADRARQMEDKIRQRREERLGRQAGIRGKDSLPPRTVSARTPEEKRAAALRQINRAKQQPEKEGVRTSSLDRTKVSSLQGQETLETPEKQTGLGEKTTGRSSGLPLEEKETKVIEEKPSKSSQSPDGETSDIETNLPF